MKIFLSALLPLILVSCQRQETAKQDDPYQEAMRLLLPHLTWHGGDPQRTQFAGPGIPADAPNPDWAEAHRGEPWMREHIPPAVIASHEKRLAALPLQLLQQEEPETNPGFFWRLDDPGHPEISKAIAILEKIDDPKASAWVRELVRNNTILTLDVPGALVRGKKGSVVLDARNVDRVDFKVYRIERAEDLVWVNQGIARDFIFQDWRTEDMEKLEAAWEQWDMVRGETRQLERTTSPATDPHFLKSSPLSSWSMELTSAPDLVLPYYSYSEDDWWSDEPDGWKYDDRCEAFDYRLRHGYSEFVEAGNGLTAWRISRRVEIPASVLDEPGALVLVAEANGRKIFAPLLVDPLSMTLRRCRDGVLAIVSDTSGEEAIPGATVHASGQLDAPAKTDAGGVAFVKVGATGDKAIMAQHEGRFAIGGFGRVFRGIYDTDGDDHPVGLSQLSPARMLPTVQEPGVANVFADKLVAVAYTDRPIYRPGQEVNFKMILRRLGEIDSGKLYSGHTGFRAGDFDTDSRLELLPPGTSVEFEILDPKGRLTDSGSLDQTDFGTASTAVTLGSEAAHGMYSIRIRHGGKDHLIPSVFQLADYRRANFEISVVGIPVSVGGQENEISFSAAAATYYGEPLPAAIARARLLPATEWKSLAETSSKTNEQGEVKFNLSIPPSVAPGDYRVIIEITDTDGRTVTETKTLRRLGEAASGSPDFPKFVKIGEHFQTPAGTKRFDKGGWQHIEDGAGNRHPVFVFGKGIIPTISPGQADASDWVNLADYTNYRSLSRAYVWNKPPAFVPEPVLAIFSGHQAYVGETLDLLIYHHSEKPRRLVFTYEGRTADDYEIITVPPSTNDYQIVSIPIRKRHAPNIYLQAHELGAHHLPEQAAEQEYQLVAQEVAAEDGAEDPLWCRIDVTDPNVLPGGETLTVKLTSDKETYRPGEKASVDIHVTGRDGTPRDAEVSLAAVDASVFAFAEGKEPLLSARLLGSRPPRLFLPKPWRSSVGKKWTAGWLQSARHPESLQRVAEMAQAMASEAAAFDTASPTTPENLRPERAFPAPGDLLPVLLIQPETVRADFRETAAWQPILRTGPDGSVSSAFNLPDSLTRYRLSAVALTRETEIGTSRAEIATRLPLKVRLSTPRFATEGDSLELVATADRDPGVSDQPVTMSWEILEEGIWRSIPSETVSLDRDSYRSRIPVDFTKPGEFSVRVHAGDDVNSDSEQRTFPVNPWGRERPLAFHGIANSSKTIALPEGLTIRAVTSRFSTKEHIDVIDSLEGLRTLLGFPYGCVEQTMSRFLPAVVARDALRDTSISLPGDIERELPEYVKAGLTRLYGFQRENGAWGWWEKDGADARMTAYVVYGLARCQAGGIEVDQAVLEKATTWLAARLVADNLPADIGAEAWLALSIAKSADTGLLAKQAMKLLEDPGISEENLCLYALACHHAERKDLAQRLWKKSAQPSPATSPRGLAIQLTAQFTFDATLADCLATAEELTALRTGFAWGDTRSTSWAIDGLSRIIPLLPPVAVPEKPVDSFATLALDDGLLFDTRTKAAERQAGGKQGFVSNDFINRNDAVMGSGKKLVVNTGGEKDFSYRIEVDAVQKQEPLEPVATTLRISREFQTLDGEPVSGAIPVGEVVEVTLKLHLDQPASYVMIESPRPAGFEFADDSLGGKSLGAVANREFRDTRLAVFFPELPAGDHELKYHLRAETAGVSRLLPAVAEPMYDRQRRAETGSGNLRVSQP